MGNVLVLGAGYWQIPLIKFLQSKGHFVIVIDPNEKSPGVDVANKHIKADVREQEYIVHSLADTQLDFISTDQTDLAVVPCQKLAQHYNLPTNSDASVQLFTNKFFSRKFAQETGVSIPKWRQVRTVQELQVAISEIGLPVIIKPPDSQASCGVFKIEQPSVESLSELLPLCLQHTNTGYALCEEYVSGEHITVEGFCSNGKHRSVAASTKSHFASGVISQLLYPSTVPEPHLEQLFSENDRYVEASGLNFGITHAEYIVDTATGKFWLVEIACRGGGTLLSSDIAKWVSGTDLYELLYRELQGKHTDLSKLTLLKRAALLEFFEFGEGKVVSIDGVVNALNIEGVSHLRLSIEENDVLKLAENGRTRHGFFIAFGNTHTDVKAIAKAVNETVQVRLAERTPDLVQI